MNSGEFLRWLRKAGCAVERSRGKGGHVKVVRGKLESFVPTHGGKKDIPTGTIDAIKKQLGLK